MDSQRREPKEAGMGRELAARRLGEKARGSARASGLLLGWLDSDQRHHQPATKPHRQEFVLDSQPPDFPEQVLVCSDHRIGPFSEKPQTPAVPEISTDLDTLRSQKSAVIIPGRRAYFPPHRHFGGSPVFQQIAMSTVDSPNTLERKPGMFW